MTGGLHPENVEIVQDIQALAKIRNRVCHAAYQDYMSPNIARMSDGPNDAAADNTARETDAIGALEDARISRRNRYSGTQD